MSYSSFKIILIPVKNIIPIITATLIFELSIVTAFFS